MVLIYFLLETILYIYYIFVDRQERSGRDRNSFLVIFYITRIMTPSIQGFVIMISTNAVDYL